MSSSPTLQLILILQAFCHFTYVTTHSPTLPWLYLRHSSFSNPVASPTSQFILQPSFRFYYVTGFSLTSPGEPLMLKCLIRNSLQYLKKGYIRRLYGSQGSVVMEKLGIPGLENSSVHTGIPNSSLSVCRGTVEVGNVGIVGSFSRGSIVPPIIATRIYHYLPPQLHLI